MVEQKQTLSDEQVLEVLAEAARQYEGYVQLSKLAEIGQLPEEAPAPSTAWSWDRPIGITFSSQAPDAVVE